MPKINFPGKASDFLNIGVAAAARGDMEAVRAILEERPGWLTRVGPHGRTMLWEASHRGRLDVVEYLLEGGADALHVNRRGETATMVAAKVGVELVVERS